MTQQRRIPKTRAGILKRLREIADDLDRVPGLYAERLQLFEAGRAMQPRILQRELADASKITETAVTKELKRPAKPKAKG